MTVFFVGSGEAISSTKFDVQITSKQTDEMHKHHIKEENKFSRLSPPPLTEFAGICQCNKRTVLELCLPIRTDLFRP